MQRVLPVDGLLPTLKRSFAKGVTASRVQRCELRWTDRRRPGVLAVIEFFGASVDLFPFLRGPVKVALLPLKLVWWLVRCAFRNAPTD